MLLVEEFSLCMEVIPLFLCFDQCETGLYLKFLNLKKEEMTHPCWSLT